MDAEEFAALSRLLDEALELPAAERVPWVESLPLEYDALKPRLRSLFAAVPSGVAPTFAETLPELTIDGTDGGPVGSASAHSGTAVGPYRLTRELGEGGMGTVWLGERTDGLLKRPVAIKLPHIAGPRSGLAERVAREREILGALNHPNIARLYDAGVAADGKPYLALELVDGRPIDEYCRDERLDVKARLRLFLQVARAVAHAHANLIVHRDLKPSNILVTADGEAKLLDFGIAKLLDDGATRETALTQLAGRPLTLEYASPEQVGGDPITVASDVYSLGVVLYELLGGVRPHDVGRGTRRALEDAILHVDPKRPSESAQEPAVRRALSGDLDTIVLKALKKAPADRYATVNALAEDIERYLDGRPVLAQPDTATYRLSKFVARNRLAVAAASAVFVAVIAGAGMAIWQARVALAEKARAEEVKDFIAAIFRDANPYEGSGTRLSAVDLLKQARKEIDRVGGTRPETRVELLNLVGLSLMNLGDTDAAEGVARQAVTESQQGLGADHPLTLHARLLMTDVHRFRGRTKEMRDDLAELVPLARAQGAENPEDLIRALENQAHVAVDDGNYDEARSAAGEAFELARARLGDRHPRSVAAATILAESHLYGSKPNEALPVCQRVFQLVSDAYPGQPKHPHVIYMRDVYGRALAEAGHVHRAVEEMNRAVRDGSEVFGAANRTIAFYAGNVAPWQRRMGDIKGALENLDRSLTIHGAHAQPESYTYAEVLTTRGVTWLAARRGREALADLSSATDTLRKVLGASHWATLTAQFNGAIALAYLGRIDDARKALALVRDKSPDVQNVMWAQHVLGSVERMAGDYAAALRAQQASLGLIKEGPRAGWDRVRALGEAGLDQVEIGAYEDAIATLEKARELFTQLQTQMHPARADVLIGLGRAHLSKGDAATALPLLEEADRFWVAFDSDNRWAGEAALWLGLSRVALGRDADARVPLARARRIFARSPMPTDARLLRLAQAR
jgi:serine/threonine-protein kinase